MASISKLEMAPALSADNRIDIKKSFFSTKGIHVPSGQKLDVVVNEYDQNGGASIETLLKASDDKLAAELARIGVPQPAAIGNLRLEIVLTPDHQFAAVQAFRYSNLRYQPTTELRFLEGAAAETISQLVK